MLVTRENIKLDIAIGQWFRTMVPTIPIMLEARDHGRDVCICLQLGKGGNTDGQGLAVEAVVPSLETFCTQLGFLVKDVVWHYWEGVAEETRSERSVVGFPNRMLAASWRARASSLAVLVLFIMGGSLIALGLPLLQAPWWLALSLASYTLAGSVRGILLPHLRPSFSTVVFAQRHFMFGQGKGAVDPVQPALGNVQEDRVNRILATSKVLLIAAITPAVGWLIDLFGSVDLVLVIAGLFFVLLKEQRKRGYLWAI